MMFEILVLRSGRLSCPSLGRGRQGGNLGETGALMTDIDEMCLRMRGTLHRSCGGTCIVVV